jgi:hypothetical protein
VSTGRSFHGSDFLSQKQHSISRSGTGASVGPSTFLRALPPTAIKTWNWRPLPTFNPPTLQPSKTQLLLPPTLPRPPPPTTLPLVPHSIFACLIEAILLTSEIIISANRNQIADQNGKLAQIEAISTGPLKQRVKRAFLSPSHPTSSLGKLFASREVIWKSRSPTRNLSSQV